MHHLACLAAEDGRHVKEVPKGLALFGVVQDAHLRAEDGTFLTMKSRLKTVSARPLATEKPEAGDRQQHGDFSWKILENRKLITT